MTRSTKNHCKDWVCVKDKLRPVKNFKRPKTEADSQGIENTVVVAGGWGVGREGLGIWG